MVPKYLPFGLTSNKQTNKHVSCFHSLISKLLKIRVTFYQLDLTGLKGKDPLKPLLICNLTTVYRFLLSVTISLLPGKERRHT